MPRCNSRRKELVAHGSYAITKHLRANVYLPREVFDRIRGLAVDDGMSFSATVKGLIADGLAKREREVA